uniref:Uncharacterized protein n=1 Tax=Anguilla anguilla TaxID=7936 RepID=A0A0E9U293_ANGAN
MNVKRFPLAF